HLLTLNRLIAMPAFQRVFFFSNFLNHAFSYKTKKAEIRISNLCLKRILKVKSKLNDVGFSPL
ncbi:hypothetical protein B5F53_19095, partial [Blautia sp. An249]|uniref:hypothetical protein n=1 Tax=Blautia sp. An249 TaxID=1965603 RepID=UPI000B5761AA